MEKQAGQERRKKGKKGRKEGKGHRNFQTNRSLPSGTDLVCWKGHQGAALGAGEVRRTEVAWWSWAWWHSLGVPATPELGQEARNFRASLSLSNWAGPCLKIQIEKGWECSSALKHRCLQSSVTTTKDDSATPTPHAGPAAMAKEVVTPRMKRSCTSTVSCLGLAWRGGLHLPLLSPFSDALAHPVPNPAWKLPFLRLVSPCLLSQSPHTSHVPGPSELRGPTAGCASVRQGIGRKKCHTGEEPGSRQAGHLAASVPSRDPTLYGSSTHQATPSLEVPPIHCHSLEVPHPLPTSTGKCRRVSVSRGQPHLSSGPGSAVELYDQGHVSLLL